MRYFIEISYNGKNYHGWQVQPDAASVQEVLEKSLSTLLRKEIKITGAGRTDTGVHAKQLFAHFDTEPLADASVLQFRLNSLLPKDISVKNILEVNEEAHARFDAVEREYKYVINLEKDPFSIDLAYFIYQQPSVALMNQAAKILLDYNDFQCFSRSRTDVKTYYCNINKASWEEVDQQLIFTIAADRFLRNMVRAIVGTLLEIGFEKITLEDFHNILKSRDRSKAGASAPAQGLFLTRVRYPNNIFINEPINESLGQ
ncbi:tRNA pseudouridine(38-40) synthase TruA [Altibacter sp.]|uniref:tRNA pseudouridine(38-40) synthase TruA n=1 Tax=Altibacter sp. TaxID=2024823 RepID=UPI002584FBFC|nr:tRNA pseudouridine(38-40) synthase TruA [Altibacter sp.]MCW9037441.1 tRNA pseudouridine(38-40) synthase TruA [Altibacter sp.]